MARDDEGSEPSKPVVMQPPGGLIDLQRRPRAIQLVGGADWYLVTPGRFDLLGSGDVSQADLRNVLRELKDAGVFVCVAKPPPIETYLRRQPWAGRRRFSWTSSLKGPVTPKLRWVAQGARLAVLPDVGMVWVDDEHLFGAGEVVPLPWTDPLVELTVVRPRTVYAAMKATIGSDGPKRARLPPAAGA